MTLTQKRIVASLLFLLAALIAFCTAAYYYLQSKYPTSTDFIQRNLGLPTIAEQSKVEKAKKAGFSEKEIADYLAQRNSQKLWEYMNNILLIELAVKGDSYHSAEADCGLWSRRQASGERSRMSLHIIKDIKAERRQLETLRNIWKSFIIARGYRRN